MSSAAHPERRGQFLAALAFGGWAAAIAIAPGAGAKALLAVPAVMLPLAWWTLQQPARWLACFFAAAMLLPPLPIRLGDSGPHPCLLFAALGLFSGVLWLGGWSIAPTGLTRALATLFAAMLVSVVWAAVYSGAGAAAASLARVLVGRISVYVSFYAAS